MTTMDLSKRLLNLEKEANSLRQKVETSQIVPNGDGLTAEVVEDWEFERASRVSASTKLIIDTLSPMLPGDKVKIGPFADEHDARMAQAALSVIARKNLKWPSVDDGKPYESHVRGQYLFVKRL